MDKKVTELYDCNLCSAKAIWDAPTSDGRWAYMCAKCAKKHSRPAQLKMGTRFELVSPVKRVAQPKDLI